MQRGAIFQLKTTGAAGLHLWAYRFRLDGRGSRRIQRGGYANPDDPRAALQRALTAAQRRKGRVRVTLVDLADQYLRPTRRPSPGRRPSCAGCSPGQPPRSAPRRSPNSTRERSPPGE
jgi:hypothetical protein